MSSGMLIPAVMALGAIATLAMREFSRRQGLLDHPNQRSSHSLPTPRLGGIAIVIATFVGWFGLLPAAGSPGDVGAAVIAGAFIAGLVGAIDDFWTISPALKFLGELAAVAVPLASVLVISSATPVAQLAAITVFALAYMNFFNFMDGSDGLAAGVGTVAAIGLAILAAHTGSAWTMWMDLAVAAATAGFLLFNRPPASIFMGDAGSLFLGYCLAMSAVSVAASGGGIIPPLVVLMPFVFDASVTLMRRAVRGEVLWHAHRSHMYQRLLRLGATHLQVAVLYWAWTVASVLLAWVAVRASVRWAVVILLIDAAPGLLLLCYLFLREHRAFRTSP